MNAASENRHILLQHSLTRMYYIRNGDWTSDPVRARDFVTTHAALLYAHSEGLGDAQPVIHYRRAERHDIILPLGMDSHHAYAPA